MAKRDYYQVLGVPKNATDEEIKKSYRQLEMIRHPDRNQGEGAKKAEEEFKEVKEAYEILSDSQKRAAYNQYGHFGLENGVERMPRAVPPHTARNHEKDFADIFEDFAATAAAEKRRIDDKKAKVKEAQKIQYPTYDIVKTAYAVYEAFAEALQNISDDVRAPYCSVSNMEENAKERIKAIEEFAQDYKEHKKAEEVSLNAKEQSFKDLSAYNVILQRINMEHGDTLLKLQRNILDVTDYRFGHDEKVIVERLSVRNTDITDLVTKLESRRPSKVSMMFSDNRAIARDIDRRVTRLGEMVDQYRQIAPILTELGYVGDGYNESGRNGDIPFAVSNILREIEEVPEKLRWQDPEIATPASFEPHKIFKSCGLFRRCHNDPEINAFLTPEQRKLVAWAQTQVDQYSIYDMIDEEVVSAALSKQHIDKAKESFDEWKKYVDRALEATNPAKAPQPIKAHLETKEKLQRVLSEMGNLFSITDDYFERNLGTFNSHAVVDQYITLARAAQEKVMPVLNKPLLDRDEAVLILRGIDPKIKLTGILKGAENTHDPSALYEDRIPL